MFRENNSWIRRHGIRENMSQICYRCCHFIHHDHNQLDNYWPMNNYGNGGGGILNDYGGSGHWNSNGGGSGHWNSNGWNSPYNGRLTHFELVVLKKVQILGVLFSFIKMSMGPSI